MSKKIVVLGLCAALSACVVYAPTYVSEDQNTVVHYESTSTVDSHSSTVKPQTKEVSERVVQKVAQPRDQRPLAVCGAFTLPREAQKPEYLTDAMLANVKDLPELDRLVGLKMKELQTHIDKVHSRYEQAHDKWLEACIDKLLR